MAQFTERWIAGSGVGLTWTNCFNTADLTSLAYTAGAGSSVLSSVADITNGTALDIYCDVSFNLASLAVAAGNFIGLYLYPLNQDASTYGDANFVAGTQKAAVPGYSYLLKNITFPTGTAAAHGTLIGLNMPPGSFRFAIWNQMGVAFSASTNAIQYRTYNRAGY
jgi:hypothetical protein